MRGSLAIFATPCETSVCHMSRSLFSEKKKTTRDQIDTLVAPVSKLPAQIITILTSTSSCWIFWFDVQALPSWCEAFDDFASQTDVNLGVSTLSRACTYSLFCTPHQVDEKTTGHLRAPYRYSRPINKTRLRLAPGLRKYVVGVP